MEAQKNPNSRNMKKFIKCKRKITTTGKEARKKKLKFTRETRTKLSKETKYVRLTSKNLFRVTNNRR